MAMSDAPQTHRRIAAAYKGKSDNDKLAFYVRLFEERVGLCGSEISEITISDTQTQQALIHYHDAGFDPMPHHAAEADELLANLIKHFGGDPSKGMDHYHSTRELATQRLAHEESLAAQAENHLRDIKAKLRRAEDAAVTQRLIVLKLRRDIAGGNF